jgi:hypothetical protein
MGLDDLPWLHQVCAARYPERFNPQSTEGWYRNIVLQSPLLFYPARTDHAFCISMLSLVPWFPNDLECNTIMICAEDGWMWHAIHLLRNSIDWARSRKCTVWRVSSETDYNFEPLARRLGCTSKSPRFSMRL